MTLLLRLFTPHRNTVSFAARPTMKVQPMRWSLPLSALLMLTLAACGDKQEGGPPGGPPPVTVATPLVRPIVDWDEYVGRFEAVQSVEVRPQVTGYLQRIAFRDGQFVKAGDLLFQIDPRPFKALEAQARAEVGRARAAAEVARTIFARSEKLLAADAVSREEFENTRAQLLQADAALVAAEATARARALDVGFTEVRAPIGGRLSDRRVDVGALVRSGETVLTTVVTLDPIRFTFTGSESVYLKYQRANLAGTRPSSRVSANPVDIRLADETEYRWHGNMDFVDNAIDLGSGTIRGRAVLRNPDGFLTPGMFGHMRLIGSGSYDGMLIPDGAIVTDQTRKVALVVGPDNVVKPAVLTLGPLVEGLRVVRSGLAATDKVIIDGVQRARPGTKVTPKLGKIVPPAPGTGPVVPSVITPPAAEATAAGSQ
jgi:RND family efflux transporter MFP subunit